MNSREQSIKKADVMDLSFADLRVHYGTGRSNVISGFGRNCKREYRRGVQTNLGDLKISEWTRLMHALIAHVGEQQLHSMLIEWVRQNYPWNWSKGEIEHYALKLHACRIFGDPKWIDYIPFNRKYRPDVLKGDCT